MSTTKFSSLSTDNLLTILEKQKGSHEDMIEVREILYRREVRRDKAAAAIENAAIDSILASNSITYTISINPLAVVRLNPDSELPYVLGVHETLCWPMRDDNGMLLGRFACNKDKPVIQNREMLELGIRLANADDSEVTFIKTTGNGESIIIAIRAGGLVKVGKDTVQRYIYLLDNRTSEHGLRIGFGETNLRCANQMQFVNKNAAHKIRHTKNMFEKIDNIIDTYDVLAEEMEAHHKFMLELVNTTYNIEAKRDKVVIEFIAALTEVDLKNDYANERTPAGWDLAVTLSDCIYEEAEAIGWNAWTLLNGVTRLTTHHREILYPRTDPKSLEEGLAYGKEGDLLAKAYQILMMMIV